MIMVKEFYVGSNAFFKNVYHDFKPHDNDKLIIVDDATEVNLNFKNRCELKLKGDCI